jgi:hypothetical protein
LLDCIVFITHYISNIDKFRSDEYEVVMPLSRLIGKPVVTKSYRVKYKQRLKSYEWPWIIAFAMISFVNGWLLRVSSVPPLIAICFTIFPLIYLVYAVYLVFKNTHIFILLIVILWSVFAFSIVGLNLPSLSFAAIILYTLNIILFGFVLIEVMTDSGLAVLLFIIPIVVLTLWVANWETVLRFVWFFNVMVIASTAGNKMYRFCQNFDTAMMVLTGVGASSLALGWVLGGIKWLNASLI